MSFMPGSRYSTFLPIPFPGSHVLSAPPSLKPLCILLFVRHLAGKDPTPLCRQSLHLTSVSFDMYKKLIDLMGSYLPVVGITSGVTGNRFGTTQKASACAISCVWVTFSSNSFRLSGLTLRVFIYLDLMFEWGEK